MMTQYLDDSQSVPAFRGCSKIPAIMIECYKSAMDESLIFQELLSQREAFPVILVCSGTSGPVRVAVGIILPLSKAVFHPT